MHLIIDAYSLEDKKPVLLGLMPPLTGVVALYGPEISMAARIACMEVNESGGVLGRPLELLVEDDGSLPETAVPAANQLVDAGCSAIIGNLLSNSRISVASRVAEPRKIPYLNFSFYEGSITGRYFFHFAALPNQQIDKMIPYMAQHFGSKMYFCGNNYEWPIGSIDAAKVALRVAGGELVGEEYFPIDTDNFDALLDRVAKSGADVFVPYAAGSDQLNLLTQFAEKGLKNRMAVVMGHYDEAMVSALTPEVREDLFSCNTYFMSIDTPENKHYLERMSALPEVTGIWPHGNGVLTNFGEGTYLCVKAFAKAANETGSLDGEALVEALEHISVTGPQGRVDMDSETHHAAVNTYLARCTAEGTFPVIECFGQIAPVIPQRYRAAVNTRSKAAADDVNVQQVMDSGASLEPPSSISQYDDTLSTKAGMEGQLFRIAGIAILAVDESATIIHANDSACRQFGYPGSEIIGLSLTLLLPPHLREKHGEHLRDFAHSEDTQRSMGVGGEITGYRKDGTFFPAQASISKFDGPNGRILVATLSDITARKQGEDDLVWQATHDPLTNLPNRALIQDRLSNALMRSSRTGQYVAVMFIDLDSFKLINDNYGHESGDQLLVALGNRLVDIVRPGDAVGRFGGDEFVIVCDQIDDANVVTGLAQRIVESFQEPMHIGDTEAFATVSLGLVIGNGQDSTTDELLRNADAAMYHAKEHGRDGWMIFNKNIGLQSRQNLDVANGLRKAVENNELMLLYQPIVEANSHEIIGAEALLRWNRPGDFIGPDVFIPIAEKNGMIVPIGQWVFEQACRVLAEWGSQGCGKDSVVPYMSINLSARQFDDKKLVANFSGIIKETGANPEKIVLEITETSLVGDVDTSLAILNQLHDLGLGLAVDDFGTGYSSLSKLMQLPFDTLKVDRAFVNGIELLGNNHAVTSAIIKMAHELRLQVVAEGVETLEQLSLLQKMDCDRAQGFYFSRPVSTKDFNELLSSQAKKTA